MGNKSSKNKTNVNCNKSDEPNNKPIKDATEVKQINHPAASVALQESILTANQLNDTNMIYVVGKNGYNEIGIHKTPNIEQLTACIPIIDHKNIIEHVHTGLNYIISTDKNNNFWATGCNDNGQCGTGFTSNWTPLQIKYFKNNDIIIQKLCTNISGSCTFWISSTNQLYGNGYNEYYQLGIEDSSNFDRYEPELININNVIDAQSAHRYSIILCDTMLNKNMITIIIKTWYKSSQQIPNDIINVIFTFAKIYEVYSTDSNFNEYSNQKPLQLIDSLSSGHIIQIACGEKHSLFLEANGMLWSSGDNSEGQLGLKQKQKMININTPSMITYFLNNKIIIKDIQSGKLHNLALDDNGNVYSWGKNKYGQCGHIADNIYTPKLIVYLQHYKIIRIKCGNAHSYVMTDTKHHYLFGGNHYNQCTLYYDSRNEIKKPFCINDIFEKITNSKIIKDVYLGVDNTIIIGR